MTFSDRLIAAMGNKGFRHVGHLLDHSRYEFEGMGNGKRIWIDVPQEEPEDDPEAVVFALVIEATAKVAANG